MARIISAVGPLRAAPPTIGVTATVRRAGIGIARELEDWIDRDQRVRRADDHQVRTTQRVEHLLRRHRAFRRSRTRFAEPGLQALADVVLLERELPVVGRKSRADDTVRHREHARRDAEATAELEGRLGQRRTAAQHLRAEQVRGEVAVADLKPDVFARAPERVENAERVVLDAVPGLVR
jgi:hypothetical protein